METSESPRTGVLEIAHRDPGWQPTQPVIAPQPTLPGRHTPAPRRKYLRPAYADAFACISSACEDTCCQGWSVPIDRETYARYETAEMMKPHMGKLIVLNPNPLSSSDYGRMNLAPNGACAFLDSDRLCGIQKQLGSTMLSDTCATYPRAIATRSGEQEKALNLSCPEAARLTLLDINLLRNRSSRMTPAERYATALREAGRSPGPELVSDKTPYNPRLALRDYALALTGDRSYPLWQRMFLLGSLTRRLQTLSGATPPAVFASENSQAVAELLVDSASIVATGRMRPLMNEMDGSIAEQLPLVLTIVRLRISQAPVPSRFLECLADFELGIGCATATSEREILDNYRRGHRQFYRPLLQKHPHLLENLAMNYIFKNNYPFGRRADHDPAPGDAIPNAEQEHMLLCVHLALAQTLLIGIAAHRQNTFSLEHVVKLVQSLARTIEHSQHFLNQIRQLIIERNLNNSRGVVLLLREET
jgi:lysine-N-methylase